MIEKEINQLKRGRVLGKVREQKKVPTVGEVTDSASVLEDSIAKKHQQYGSKGHTSSQSSSIGKTTTVDTVRAVDEVLIPSEAGPSHNCSTAKQKNDHRNSRNNSSSRRPIHSTQREKLNQVEKFDDNTNLSFDSNPKQKLGRSPKHDDSYNHDRTSSKKASYHEESYAEKNPDCFSKNNCTGDRSSNSTKYFRNFYENGETYSRQCSKESKCGIKCFWNKILTFLGLKTPAKDKCTKIMDNHNKKHQPNQTKEINRHSNGQNNRKNKNR